MDKRYSQDKSDKIRSLNISESIYFNDIKLTFIRSEFGIRMCKKIKNNAGEVIQMICRDLDEQRELAI